MGSVISRRATCRLCRSKDVVLAFSLEPTPPANAFVAADALYVPQQCFPLDVFFCRSCTHVQLLDVVDPRALFEHYVYVSGTSPSFVRHFQSYAQDVARRVALAPGALAVDVGSNDGTLLKAFKTLGAGVLGIDPARAIAAAATEDGVETWPEFFDAALARRIVAERGLATVITANNVFAHVDDLAGIADGVRLLLGPEGVFVFEVSYLLDVVEKVLFDTIYHEHLDYHAVGPLVPFLREHDLELIEAIRVPTHGGSLRGIAGRKDALRAVGKSVADALAAERTAGLHRLETYTGLSQRIDRLAGELRTLLLRLKGEGRRIAGFGAPAKATTLMYHFGIGPDIIDYIVDDSPLKQGLFSPGMHVPVLPPSAIAEREPDYLLILAWNFAEQIIARYADFRKGGGRFIIPVPKLEIV
jgi:C-methyltransferase C-terminal domain/Putative zinc binding domain/Methyltransferase domain